MRLTQAQIAAAARESKRIAPNCAQELGIYPDGSCEISVGPHGFLRDGMQHLPAIRIKHPITRKDLADWAKSI